MKINLRKRRVKFKMDYYDSEDNKMAVYVFSQFWAFRFHNIMDFLDM